MRKSGGNRPGNERIRSGPSGRTAPPRHADSPGQAGAVVRATGHCRPGVRCISFPRLPSGKRRGHVSTDPVIRKLVRTASSATCGDPPHRQPVLPRMDPTVSNPQVAGSSPARGATTTDGAVGPERAQDESSGPHPRRFALPCGTRHSGAARLHGRRAIAYPSCASPARRRGVAEASLRDGTTCRGRARRGRPT